jgi:hypothetical protein
MWMISSRVFRASDCQCRNRNSPGLNPSIIRHIEILGAVDEAVLNKVHTKKYIQEEARPFFAVVLIMYACHNSPPPQKKKTITAPEFKHTLSLSLPSLSVGCK